MGAVLIIGFAVVVATLVKRSGEKPVAGESALALPAGAHLVETTAAGGSIVLRVANGTDETLIILDGKTGAETGRVHLVSSDKAPD